MGNVLAVETRGKPAKGEMRATMNSFSDAIEPRERTLGGISAAIFSGRRWASASSTTASAFAINCKN
jgi:hypothetical protein